ncbi:MAG TPA: hypothetical protein DD412_08015, partial [Holosporales bacterium]|nr:hypothetical protein [Holosporales bacterium]
MKKISFANLSGLCSAFLFLFAVNVQASFLVSKDEISRINENWARITSCATIPSYEEQIAALDKEYCLTKDLPVSFHSFNVFVYSLNALTSTILYEDEEKGLGSEKAMEKAKELFDHPYFQGKRDLSAELKENQESPHNILNVLDVVMGFYFQAEAPDSFECLFRVNDLASSLLEPSEKFKPTDNNYILRKICAGKYPDLSKDRRFDFLLAFLEREGRGDMQHMRWSWLLG